MVYPPAFTTGWSCSAKQEALTKADMKPSFTPCFFRNSSLNLFLMSVTLLEGEREKAGLRVSSGLFDLCLITTSVGDLVTPTVKLICLTTFLTHITFLSVMSLNYCGRRDSSPCSCVCWIYSRHTRHKKFRDTRPVLRLIWYIVYEEHILCNKSWGGRGLGREGPGEGGDWGGRELGMRLQIQHLE